MTRLHHLRALRRDQSGLALVEFAISLPVLLVLGLTGIEVANFAIANLRISEIAETTADNAARVRDSIDETDVNELMTGAKTVGTQIKFADNGRVIVSDLEPRSDGTGQWIRWQRCYGAKNYNSTYGVPKTAGNTTITNGTESALMADGKTANPNPSDQTKSVPTDGTKTTLAGMGAPANQVAAANGTALMFVEVFYEYQPIVANRLIGNQTLHYTAAYNVRQRTNQVMQNVSKLTNSQIMACNNFNS
jgi:hypothetical protein